MVILQPCSGINRCCCVCVMKHVCMHSRFPVSAVFSSAHGSDKSNHSEFSWSVLSGQTAGMSVMIWVHGTDKAAPWAGHVWADWCRHRGKMVLVNMETNVLWVGREYMKKAKKNICWHFLQRNSHQYVWTMSVIMLTSHNIQPEFLECNIRDLKFCIM